MRPVVAKVSREPVRGHRCRRPVKAAFASSFAFEADNVALYRSGTSNQPTGVKSHSDVSGRHGRSHRDLWNASRGRPSQWHRQAMTAYRILCRRSVMARAPLRTATCRRTRRLHPDPDSRAGGAPGRANDLLR
jgi:hypothetical protein